MSASYTTEQQDAIDAALEESKNTLNGWIDYEWSENIVERGPQRFAIFGHRAFELLRFDLIDDGENHIEYQPMLVEGRMLLQSPDEGREGMAYLMRVNRAHGKTVDRPSWSVIYIPTGWLYTRELTLSNAEIDDNISEEIDEGAPHVTGARPGYVV